jgi:hypothetical protein
MSLALRGMAFVVAFTLGLTASASGQSIAGRVVEEPGGRPVPYADVLVLSDTLVVVRTQTGADGTFRLVLRSAGAYVLSVRMLGYVSLDAVPVRLRHAEELSLTLRLARSAIPLDPLTVDARRSDVRHSATWEGFLARRELLPPIGNRRAIRWDDHEMVAAGSVQDVLRWVIVPQQRQRGCIVTIVDGVRRRHNPFENMFDFPADLIDGIEYYARVVDAPLDYASQSEGCGVIAIWLRKRR